MSFQAIELGRLAALRGQAALRLTGKAATMGPAARAGDALSVLHALASSPDTAGDALTLLHELQVHQVELELQAQELIESRFELESALRRQTELYDFQPVGCFTVDARLVLHELNLTGADMLGVARDEAQGQGLDAFMNAPSVRRLKSAITSLGEGLRRTTCRVDLHTKDAPVIPVLACIAADHGAERYLLTLMNAADDVGERPAAASGGRT
jgi:PAS domain-containing protein